MPPTSLFVRPTRCGLIRFKRRIYGIAPAALCERRGGLASVFGESTFGVFSFGSLWRCAAVEVSVLREGLVCDVREFAYKGADLAGAVFGPALFDGLLPLRLCVDAEFVDCHL